MIKHDDILPKKSFRLTLSRKIVDISELVCTKSENKRWSVAEFSGGLWSINSVEPIKITENCVVNFGFESNQDEHDEEWYHPECDTFGLRYNALEDKWEHIWDVAFTDAPCEYVHQLQGLFHAMTGKELINSYKYPTK